jgi:hypothetical protein
MQILELNLNFGGTQAPELSYMHGMREEGQDIEVAKEMSAYFIGNSLRAARYFAQHCNRSQALKQLAHAMHTMMDITSPLHRDIQGNPIEWVGGEQYLTHLLYEGVSEITPSIYSQMDATLYAAYSYVFYRNDL